MRQGYCVVTSSGIVPGVKVQSTGVTLRTPTGIR